MYAKVLLCLALPAVASAMGVIVDDRKTCQGPDGSSATATKFADVATKDDCISFCQSESAAYGDNCRRTIIWEEDCGDSTSGICDLLATSVNNCYCNYQTTCGCECYFCFPDWSQDIDPQGGTYPEPDFDAISVCETHAFAFGETCY